jgi:YD repeat-containing protein
MATQHITYSYDNFGSVFIRDATQAMTIIRLGSGGQPIDVQAPLMHHLRLEYDQSNNLTRLIGPDGGVSSLAYDATGNAIQIGDQLGHTTAMGYTTTIAASIGCTMPRAIRPTLSTTTPAISSA